MSYTDEQIEAVVSAYRAAHDRSYQSYRIDSAARKAGCEAARTALEAMEREPLENVLRDTATWLQHLEVALQDDGRFACTVYGYEVTGTDSPVMDATRYGADPAEAIHNAIAAAQEER